jgi:hypothetical protein
MWMLSGDMVLGVPLVIAGVPGGLLGLLGMAEEGCCFWDAVGKVSFYGRLFDGRYYSNSNRESNIPCLNLDSNIPP